MNSQCPLCVVRRPSCIVPCHQFAINDNYSTTPRPISIKFLKEFCYFLWDDSGYFENRIPLKPAPGGVCSLANYSVAYEETQSNHISDFRDFVCSLFPKTILF